MDRFAEPKIRIAPEEGWKVSKIFLNGEDVTEQFKDGYLTLEEVCEDLTLVIETAEDTTGDEARPMLYALAAIAAVAVVISVTVIRRKNK